MIGEGRSEVHIASQPHFRMRSTFLSVNGAAVEIAPELAGSRCLASKD